MQYLRSDVIRLLGWLIEQPEYANLALLAPHLASSAPMLLWACEGNTYMQSLAVDKIFPQFNNAIMARPQLFAHIALRLVALVEHMGTHLSLNAKVFLLEIKAMQTLGVLIKSWSIDCKALDLVGDFLFAMTRQDETIEALAGSNMEQHLRDVLRAIATVQTRDKQMRLLDSIYNMLGKAPISEVRINPELQNTPGQYTPQFAYACEQSVKMLAVLGADRDMKRFAQYAATDIEAYFRGQEELIHAEARENGVEAVLNNILHSNRRLRVAALEALVNVIAAMLPAYKEPEHEPEIVEHVRYLHIERADNLKPADSVWQGGKSDPYVSVFWNGKKLAQTGVQKNTLNPRWEDATFKLISEPSETFNGSVLLFVYDHDQNAEDTFLGQSSLRFGHVGDPGGAEIELEQHSCQLLERSRAPGQGTSYCQSNRTREREKTASIQDTKFS